MTIGTNNLEEEIVVIKAMLERLVKKNEEKEVCIKLHEEKDQQVDQKAGEAAGPIPRKKLSKRGGREGVRPK